MENITIKYNNVHLSTPIKIDPEIYETNDSINWSAGENYTLENNEDDINNSCRRSRRKRIKNLRYRSDEENSTADDPLRKILIQIGLFDELYIFLKSKGITAQALEYMQLRHIDELFKGTRLNTKIIFEHRLKEWQEQNNSYMETNCSKINSRHVNLSTLNAPQQNLPGTDIKVLTNRLKNAVQTTITTFLQEYDGQQPPSDKNCNYNPRLNNEVPTDIITLQNIKTEPSMCVDETSITNKRSEKILGNSQRIFKGSDKILLPKQPTLPKKRKLNVDTNVQEILASSTTCQSLLDDYDASGLLTPTQRTQIVRCIVDFYMRNNISLSISRCKEIANEIIELFPSECTETYFIKDSKARFPKGKIWEHYQSRKRSARKLNTANSLYETIKTDSSNSDKDDTSNSNPDCSDMQAMCSQIKHINNEKERLEKWKESFAYRRQQLQAGCFTTWKLFFDEYPFCKQQSYAQYIESDLETLYPKLKFNDYLWDDFLKNFQTIFLNRIRHPKSKQLYDQLTSTENLNDFTDYVAIKVFELLHVVLKTYTNKPQSIDDVQRKFTVEVGDLSDLKKVVIERKKYCTDNNVQAKPYVAVVGQNKTYSHFSVILDSTGFSCESYKDSLILCFNLYLFFDISFPHESLNVWTFIQSYFFNKPPLLRNARVDAFISEIKNQKAVSSLDKDANINNTE